MQQNICPTCNVELEWTGQYHCAQCESDFKKVGFCLIVRRSWRSCKHAVLRVTFVMCVMNSNQNHVSDLSSRKSVNQSCIQLTVERTSPSANRVINTSPDFTSED